MLKDMKPLNRKNYGSIPHLSNSKLSEKDYHIDKGQERILTEKKRDKYDTILVFEKYDGSNVGVAKINGKIFALTRSGYEASTSPYKQHHEFAKWVHRRFKMFNSLLNDGERISGEWLYQAHGLIYNIKNEPIVFFDYFNKNNERQPFESLEKMGVPLARLLHKGDAVSVDKMKPILNLKTDSIWAEEDPEGMVYRVERKGKVDFLAKWVRQDFEAGKYCIGIDEKDLIWNVALSSY
jgi:ATP-dependent RNA circularization protein (DNA/RNA ligase family)